MSGSFWRRAWIPIRNPYSFVRRKRRPVLRGPKMQLGPVPLVGDPALSASSADEHAYRPDSWMGAKFCSSDASRVRRPEPQSRLATPARVGRYAAVDPFELESKEDMVL